jgi:hypothetical protein
VTQDAEIRLADVPAVAARSSAVARVALDDFSEIPRAEPTLDEALRDEESYARHVAPYGDLVTEVGAEARSADPESYEALALDSFLAKPPDDPDWDWTGFYARGDVVLEAGDPGVGKSMLALARSVVAASGGGELLGEPIAGRRVAFFDLESPEDVVYGRLWAFGVRGDVESLAYIHRPARFDLRDAECLARFRKTLANHRAEVCFVDSLRRAAPGLDENDSREVSTLLSALREIAAELMTTIIVIHHPRKPAGDGKVEALYAARGSGDLTGSVDSYLYYRRLPDGLVRVEHGKARRGHEHEHVHFRIDSDDSGSPVIEHVTVEAAPASDKLDEAVTDYVTQRPGASTKNVENTVTGSRSAIRKSLKRLATPGDSQRIAAGPGRHPNGNYWYPLNHAALMSPGDMQATLGDMSPRLSQGQRVAVSPAPHRGGDTPGDTMDSTGLQGRQPALPSDSAGSATSAARATEGTP